MKALFLVLLLVAMSLALNALGPPWAQGLALAFVAFGVVFSFGEVAARDRVAFASISLLPVVMGVISVGLPGDLRLVTAAVAFAWIVLFLAGGSRLWAWWTRYVLHRQLPSRQRTYEVAFSQPVRAYLAAVTPRGSVAPRVGAIDQAVASQAALRLLEPPDGDWASLQEAWLAAMTESIQVLRQAPEVPLPASQVARMSALGERQQELRAREPEWSGLHPTVRAQRN